MDCNEIAEILYAEFGHDQFLTRSISAGAMHRLGQAMGIPDTGQSLNIKVGQALSNMEGREYSLPFGKKIAMSVERPGNNSLPRRFRLVPTFPTDDTPVVAKPPAGPAARELAFNVVLTDSGYGYSVSCPALLGCHTQGKTEAEALENVREAIAGWLQAESRAAKLRTQKMLDEYNAAGYPSKIAVVSVPPLDD